MAVQKNLKEMRKIIVPILRRSDVVKAGIFGSAARGEMKRNSDIDILVKFKKGKTLLDLVGLEIDLEQALKKKVDILTYNSIHPLLKERILKEEIKLL